MIKWKKTPWRMPMKPIFRTAMFGFMKEDVAQFISRQNQEYEKKLKEKDEPGDCPSRDD